MKLPEQIEFKSTRLAVTEPCTTVSAQIYNSWGNKYYKDAEHVQETLIDVRHEHLKGYYTQYTVFKENIPIGFVRLKPCVINSRVPIFSQHQFEYGWSINKLSSQKLDLIIDDEHLTTTLLSEILFGIISQYEFNEKILFVTQMNNHIIEQALTKNMFDEITQCRFNQAFPESNNTEDCRLFLFKKTKEQFFSLNGYATDNRQKVHNIIEKYYNAPKRKTRTDITVVHGRKIQHLHDLKHNKK